MKRKGDRAWTYFYWIWLLDDERAQQSRGRQRTGRVPRGDVIGGGKGALVTPGRCAHFHAVSFSIRLLSAHPISPSPLSSLPSPPPRISLFTPPSTVPPLFSTPPWLPSTPYHLNTK